MGRRTSGIGIGERDDLALAQEEARLAECLRMRIAAGERSVAQRHQVVVDRHEVLADDRQAAFREQKVNVGDAAMLRILDRDDRAVGAAVLDRFQRVFKAEAR